jgi:hypothetical protein
LPVAVKVSAAASPAGAALPGPPLYLAKAIEQLTDLLWTVEIGEGTSHRESTDVR